MSKNSKEKWLDVPKPLFCNGRRRACIYDFDGTLFRSPDREGGEVSYLEATGKLWPFDGWFGRIETLQAPVVPDPIPEAMFIDETIAAYRKDRADKGTWTILMTGRPSKKPFPQRIKEILLTKQIEFDEYYFRGMRGLPHGSNTIDIKLDLIATRILHPKLEILEIWEDRPEHSSRFMDEARRWKSAWKKTLEKVVIHDVPAGTTNEF